MSRKTRSPRIRVGLLRADTHGYYYGSLMAPTDPALLMELDVSVHYYFTSRFFLHKFERPLTPGFEVVKVWDPDAAKAEAFSRLFFGKPIPCTRVEEMTTGIDAAFIADCSLGGEDHRALATPFLERRIPTFVDKPFAPTLADARAMIALAERRKTPLMSASILSYVPEADAFKRRFPDIGKVGMGVIKGVVGGWGLQPGAVGRLEDHLAALIHGIALGMNLFGKDVEWVEAMGERPLEYMHLHTARGVEILLLNGSIDVFPDRNDFYATAYSKRGAFPAPPIGDPEFVAGAARIVRLFKRMIRTGVPPIPYTDILRQIAVVEAGRLAQKTGRRIRLDDVLRNGARTPARPAR